MASDEPDRQPPRVRLAPVLLAVIGVLVLARILGLPLPDPLRYLVRLLPFVPLALLGGLVVGVAGGSRAAGLYTGLVLLLAPAWATVTADYPDTPGAVAALKAPRYLELALPHIFQGDGRTNLLVPALLEGPGAPRPAGARLYVGLLPLLLAVLGVVAAPGLLAWAARLALLPLVCIMGGLLMPVPSSVVRALMIATQATLAILAGLAVALLDKHEDKQQAPWAGIFTGALSVLLAGALVVAAARGGSQLPQRLAEPFAEHLVARGAEQPHALLVSQTGELLQFNLDRGAASAFAAMLALLLYLKGRGPWGLGLLLVVTAAELLVGV